MKRLCLYNVTVGCRRIVHTHSALFCFPLFEFNFVCLHKTCSASDQCVFFSILSIHFQPKRNRPTLLMLMYGLPCFSFPNRFGCFCSHTFYLLADSCAFLLFLYIEVSVEADKRLWYCEQSLERDQQRLQKYSRNDNKFFFLIASIAKASNLLSLSFCMLLQISRWILVYLMLFTLSHVFRFVRHIFLSHHFWCASFLFSFTLSILCFSFISITEAKRDEGEREERKWISFVEKEKSMMMMMMKKNKIGAHTKFVQFRRARMIRWKKT